MASTCQSLQVEQSLIFKNSCNWLYLSTQNLQGIYTGQCYEEVYKELQYRCQQWVELNLNRGFFGEIKTTDADFLHG